jgi:catechol 2,3-dioxygenase-like lactoylglutathione lyase family enzyme
VTLGLGAIDQVGFVVRDLDAACARYAPLFGPWQRAESPLTGVSFRGVPTDVHLRLAFGSAGSVEIEFIEVVSGSSPHSEFLESGREGIHHVRYRVDDCDRTLAALEEEGFEPILYADMGFAKFAYLEQPCRDGVIVELLEMEGEPQGLY